MSQIYPTSIIVATPQQKFTGSSIQRHGLGTATKTDKTLCERIRAPVLLAVRELCNFGVNWFVAERSVYTRTNVAKFALALQKAVAHSHKCSLYYIHIVTGYKGRFVDSTLLPQQ